MPRPTGHVEGGSGHETTAAKLSLIESYSCWSLRGELDRNFVIYWNKGLTKYMNAWVDLRELVLMFYPPRSVVFNYRGCGNSKLSVSGWLANPCYFHLP